MLHITQELARIYQRRAIDVEKVLKDIKKRNAEVEGSVVSGDFLSFYLIPPLKRQFCGIMGTSATSEKVFTVRNGQGGIKSANSDERVGEYPFSIPINPPLPLLQLSLLPIPSPDILKNIRQIRQSKFTVYPNRCA
jgi:hypothetical protein